MDNYKAVKQCYIKSIRKTLLSYLLLSAFEL